MRTKDFIALEKTYSLIRESRAAEIESQQAGESARALAVEKTLIRAITEDLNATASHLQAIQPLVGTFEEGEFGQDFQTLMKAVQDVAAAVQELQGRMQQSGEEMPPEGDMSLEEPTDEPVEEPMP
jgi:hypothetical protein